MTFTEVEVTRRIRALTVERLRTFVGIGLVHAEAGTDGPRFTEADIARTRLICELIDDLDIGEPAVPVVLSLLDQIHSLRCELRSLLVAVGDQPEEVRRSIRERLR